MIKPKFFHIMDLFKQYLQLLLIFLLCLKSNSQLSECYSADIALTASSSFCLYIAGNLIGCGNDYTITFYFRVTLLNYDDAVVIDATSDGYGNRMIALLCITLE